MEIPATLTADLKTLTDALDRPDTDLKALLESLADHVRRAVSSYLGLSMTVVIDSYPFTITVMHDVAGRSDVASSMRLPLPALGDVEAGSGLVFYAATPGAFVDLAADLSFALRLTPETLAMDKDLIPAAADAEQTDLAAMSQLNQALGILIGGGHLPEAARTELHRLAHHGQLTVPEAARQLIKATRQRVNPEPA